ncbi:MAG: Na/Pi cotransporter family protein [Planctomycetota bacterium JB042]
MNGVWDTAATTVGGLGLLLLGMSLMTDGLRIAAGRALHRLLERWTRTRGRGFLAGTALTAVVQSSSAITVAVIGFANAGILTLPQAAWVVFGSNLGTTTTGWIVALVGLQFEVEALALPFVGAGMLLRLARPRTRLGGAGEAVAGFGTLFLGLGYLKDAFGGIGGAVDLGALEAAGGLGVLAGAGLGALLTALMQSSSAALAVVLTASAQGLLSPTLGAAFVVGANLGTTSTAVLATLGATAQARRVAVLHVLFNLVTAGAALLLLVPLLAAIEAGRDAFGLPRDPAATLALFHTAFNGLGVVLMLPMAGALVAGRERRFTSREEDLARPRHIDPTVLPVPEVAIDALGRELGRAGALIADLSRDLLRTPKVPFSSIDDRSTAARRLLVAIGEFATRLSRGPLTVDVSQALSQLLRVHERHMTALRMAADVRLLRDETESTLEPGETPFGPGFVAAVDQALATDELLSREFREDRARAARDALDEARDAERVRVLEAARDRGWSAEDADRRLLLIGQIRRLANQLGKAEAALAGVRTALGHATPEAPAAPA